MNQRPRSITIISWLFIVFSSVVIISKLLASSRSTGMHEGVEYVPVYIGHTFTILCAVFMLRGCNWARWLFAVWVAGHIIIGALHSPGSGFVHACLFAVISYFLFSRSAADFFRGAKMVSPL